MEFLQIKLHSSTFIFYKINSYEQILKGIGVIDWKKWFIELKRNNKFLSYSVLFLAPFTFQNTNRVVLEDVGPRLIGRILFSIIFPELAPAQGNTFYKYFR